MSNKHYKNAIFTVTLVFIFSSYTSADKLDDILGKGVLRCGIVLDYPPMGFRDKKDNPIGMDVDICVDLANSMNVNNEIVSLSWAERIPSIILNSVDVVISSSSITLDRAHTIGFTIPYMKFQFQLLLSDKLSVSTWEQMRPLSIGASVGTTYESLFLDYKKTYWQNSAGKYFSFKSDAEAIKAVSEGVVDGVILSNTVVKHTINSGNVPSVKSGPIAPFGTDIVGMMALRKEYGWINYLNLFIYKQNADGRMDTLHEKWFDSPLPDTTTLGTYY